MFYVLQNESTAARRRVPILLTDSATGTTAQSGVSTASIFPYVNINGGAFIGGTGSVGEAGFGQYYYQFEANEVATLGLAGIHVTAAGCRDYDAITQIAAFDLYSASAGGGISAYDVWNYVLSDTNTAEADLVNATQFAISADNNTSSILGNQYPISDIWQWDSSTNTDPSVGYNLYQLGIGATGYAAGGGATAGDVWSYVDRTITGGIADTVQLVATPVNVSTTSMSGIANSVWDFVITGFGQTGSAALYSTQTFFTVGNIETYVANQTPQDVWTYAGIEGRTITGGLADTVTTLTNRSGFAITGGTITTVSDKTGYSLSASQTFDLTGNITGNVSGSVNSVTSPVSLSTATQASIANSVWITDVSGYTSPSAGYDLANVTTGSGISAADVWTYGNRTITGGIADTVVFPVNLSNTALYNTAFAVWSGNAATYVTENTPLGMLSTTLNQGANTLDRVIGIGATIWNYATRTLTAGGAGISAADVWSYVDRTITGGIADTVTTVTNRSGFAITGGTITTVSDKTGYSLSGTQTFNLTGNITGNLSGSVGSVTGNVGGNVVGSVGSVVGNIGGNVVGNVNGSVQSVVQDVGLSVGTQASIAEYVWIEPIRTITGGIANTVDYVNGNVNGNILGNVNGSVASVTNNVGLSLATYGGIAQSVWNAATRTLTSGGGAGISAYDVWNFVLSDANTAEVDLVQAAAGAGLTAGDVWSYTLSNAGTAEANIVNIDNSVIAIGTDTMNIPSDVWTYGVRTITGGIADTVTTLTNRSGFAITGGTITTVSDKTGYALSSAGVSAVQSGLSTLTSAQVGTEVDSSLSDVGLTSTVTGRIDVAVSSRLASSSYTTPPTTAQIWSYTPRTLTSGGGATAGDVWTYPTRSLTSGAGITVNAATNIINGPYFVKSNVDSQDGTLDVIRGMVQDIQLTVTDAFGNPFDTSALGLAVNLYDQAGTLTTSYATTELYGPAGLVQFTLDTAVTANEGRYNLILSAAGSGNTIKFGPLQTLVRPF